MQVYYCLKNIYCNFWYWALAPKPKRSLISCYLQPAVGPDGKKKEMESNVLLASIENMQYAVTVDVLHTVRAYSFCVFQALNVLR